MEREQYRQLFEIEEDHWWFRLKREFVNTLLEEFLPATPRPRVADLGAGTGIVLARLPGRTETVGVEFDGEALEFARSRGVTRLIRGSCERLPLGDETLDAALVLDVLEHLKHDDAAMAEIRRVLRPAGICILTVPAHPHLWSPHDDAMHHVRRYTRGVLEERLQRSGLRVVHSCYGFATAYPAALIVRSLRRFLPRGGPGRRKEDDFFPIPAWANRMLYRLSHWEVAAVRRGRVPIGVSLVAVCTPEPAG